MRQVNTVDAEAYCKSKNLIFMEVSAKNGEHVA